MALDDAEKPESSALVSYAEPARRYTAALVFAGLIAAGFLVDLIVGGGVSHLPGWIVAFVLVVGVDVLTIYAARATRSLTVDALLVRVGEEEIPRADVVSITDGVDLRGVEVRGTGPDGVAAELPVLGWPNGMPRRARGVTLGLADGQLVGVLTRHPDRLATALGLAVGVGGRDAERAALADAAVRPARPRDLVLLPEIERRANAVFRVAGIELPPDDGVGFDPAAAVFVIGEPVVGFVVVDEWDGAAYVHEIDVVPAFMRQGLGGRLLEHACDWAADAGHRQVLLTTFADVAWNAPFYDARGFDVVDESVHPGVAAVRDRERAAGLDAVGRRVVMRRGL